MANQNRHEFSAKTKHQIGQRAGWHCTDPSCRQLTVGSNSDGTGETNLGLAAHICAAAPGGPRYDENQTPEQRKSVDNGIWMCRQHGTAVDAKDSKYTPKLLHEWKAQAQKDSWQATLYGKGPLALVSRTPTTDELHNRICAAAAADLRVFQLSGKWPSTSITLTLEVGGFEDPVSTSTLGAALPNLDDLILVAPPGVGKTTALFQIAEALLAKGDASPIIVPLGDWSTDSATLIESIVKRHAFQGISENDLRAVAAQSGVILLLDGWNELDVAARKRATTQILRLQGELPKLTLLISTRQQTLDVPVDGTRINLLPLSQTQQLDIAKVLRGDAGARMVDQAWRTAGVRELVTIPLYLTTLLALPEGAPFPTTKEEVLRRFVSVHEQDALRAESLRDVTYGLHQRFLEGLAVTATRIANTTMSEAVARKSVFETASALEAEGQIIEKPQPSTVLDVLVSYHLLQREGDPSGYSFQHQQFQEWYASLFVESLMVASIEDPTSQNKLKVDVLNQPVWEESILFACERLARGDLKQQESCSAAIMAAFDVDPMLAAEMIYRSTDTIWAQVGSTILGCIKQWHTPGKVDRALHFMISSGRSEFFDQVWPLITHKNNQVHLSALRAGRRFRPSVLGSNASMKIAALPVENRKHVLYEIVSNSGMEGLDLATAVASNDPDPEVKAEVIGALAFRRAKRHMADVLRGAEEKTFDLVLSEDIVDELTDEHIKKGLEAALKRQQQQNISVYDRLRTIMYAPDKKDLRCDLTKIVAEMEIVNSQDPAVQLLYQLRERYSRAIADGLLLRVREGRTLFYGADDILASADFSLEDESLLKTALSDTPRHDDQAECAASVLGPQAVARMIARMREVEKTCRDSNGKHNQESVDRYCVILDRIGHTSGKSLIAAVMALSPLSGNEELANLADLICRHPHRDVGRARPFDADALATISDLTEEWGNRMLASGNATRSQLVSIALLITRVPSLRMLGLLKRLLDEELRLYRAFREEVTATGWQQGNPKNEAQTIHTHEYQRAFQAIEAPETTLLMQEYLHDEHFGQCAALVLAAQWSAKNKSSDRKWFSTRVDFSHVGEKRAAFSKDPTQTSAEAEAIFTAIESCIGEEATEKQKQHAVALGIVAARLPHGHRPVTIQELISIAPRLSRAALLQNLILSGENVSIDMIRQGIAEVFEAAKAQPWILSEDGFHLKEWLTLLPFATPLSDALDIMRNLPDNHRRVHSMEEVIACFGMAPEEVAEDILFQLAEDDPKFYGNHAWRNAIRERGTLSSARRYVNLVANGVLGTNETETWTLIQQLSSLMSEYIELRTHVYQLIKDGAKPPGLKILARALAEHTDAEGLLHLIKIEMEHKHAFISSHTIEKAVTVHVPSENMKGAYNIVPISAAQLRQQLFALTTDGGPMDIAARYLNQIDEIRDEYGAPDDEPRHPDLASGKPWPIMCRLSS